MCAFSEEWCERGDVIGIDVDDGTMGAERERQVGVALAVLVQLGGGGVVVLDRLAERGVADGIEHREVE